MECGIGMNSMPRPGYQSSGGCQKGADNGRKYRAHQVPNQKVWKQHCAGSEPLRRQRLDENVGSYPGNLPFCTTYGVMADTGFEHQRLVSAIDWAFSRCEEFGTSFAVVRNPKRTYLEMVEQRRIFPSAQFRQCTSDLKRGPIDKFIRALRTSNRELHWHPCGRIESLLKTDTLME
jgi:hypothetical protein